MLLSDEDTKWKGRDHYYNLKRAFNKEDINTLYEKIYRHPQSIGYVSELFKRLKPVSMENAYDAYILSGILDTDLPREKRGRTKEELEAIAVDWKRKTGSKMPLCDFYDALVLHAVVETVIGNLMESRAEEAYRLFGFEVEKTGGDEDRSLGIDFKAKKDGKIFLVQVKPETFFMGRKDSLVHDRLVMFDKMKAGIAKYPGGVYTIMIYNKDEKWLSDGKRFNFLYDELIGPDGYAIKDVKTLESEAKESIIG